MSQQSSDLVAIFRANHEAVNKQVNNLTEEQWVKQPGPGINNIASIVEHAALVERKIIAAIAGEAINIDAGEPFQKTLWDVKSVKKQFDDVLEYAISTLQALTDEELHNSVDDRGRTKLQLAVNAALHTAHHRGQLPIVKRLIGA